MNGMDLEITLMILDGDGDVGDDDQNVFLRPQVCLDGGGVLQHLCLQLNVVTCRWSAATVRLSLKLQRCILSGRMWMDVCNV